MLSAPVAGAEEIWGAPRAELSAGLADRRPALPPPRSLRRSSFIRWFAAAWSRIFSRLGPESILGCKLKMGLKKRAKGLSPPALAYQEKRGAFRSREGRGRSAKSPGTARSLYLGRNTKRSP